MTVYRPGVTARPFYTPQGSVVVVVPDSMAGHPVTVTDLEAPVTPPRTHTTTISDGWTRRWAVVPDDWEPRAPVVVVDVTGIPPGTDITITTPGTRSEDSIERLAAAVHRAYLDTCARLGWPVKPANAVPYEELPEDAKELDRASVRAVLGGAGPDDDHDSGEWCVEPRCSYRGDHGRFLTVPHRVADHSTGPQADT